MYVAEMKDSRVYHTTDHLVCFSGGIRVFKEIGWTFGEVARRLWCWGRLVWWRKVGLGGMGIQRLVYLPWERNTAKSSPRNDRQELCHSPRNDCPETERFAREGWSLVLGEKNPEWDVCNGFYGVAHAQGELDEPGQVHWCAMCNPPPPSRSILARMQCSAVKWNLHPESWRASF